MYTQCPECGVAFRVTAEVLRQAAGKVRCGGCGVPFNALDHLSEQRPASPARSATGAQTSESEPKLTPEPPSGGNADRPPKSISAEQSAALLKTLDQLAGEDIRIEDTGVEWRVLDVNDDVSVTTESNASNEERSRTETGSLTFVLQDQDAENGPMVIDTREQPIASDDSAPNEEMRFDDNTPLPDDFEVGVESTSRPELAEFEKPVAAQPDEPPVDVALGDPDEWHDLLGEVDGPDIAADINHDLDVDAIASDKHEDADIDVAIATEQPPDMDTQFALQAEAMGIDLSGIHARVNEVEAADGEAEVSDSAAEPTVGKAEPADTSIEEDLIAAAFESEASTRLQHLEVDSVELDELDAIAEPIDEEPDEESEEALEIEPDAKVAEEPEDLADDVADDEIAKEAQDEELEPEAEQESEEEEPPRVEEQEAVAAYDLPPQSEEELTINRMIDQELLAIAVEDDDGFTSTIVQKQMGDEDDFPKEQPGWDKFGETDQKPHIETIIMEGDFVRSALEGEAIAAQNKLDSGDIGFIARAKNTITGQLREEFADTDSPRYRILAIMVALLMLLGLQVVHQSREALATVPALNNAIGPVYRALGKPVTPAWDVRGWRFEATKGSTDETDALLTIYSRVGNNSDKPLPYPLVHVSLTDRFEEIIGSRVLEPVEYLVGNADPHRTIAPGATFNAVFSIVSPTPEATGFKLNVCYRLSSGQLRCALEDFK